MHTLLQRLDISLAEYVVHYCVQYTGQTKGLCQVCGVELYVFRGYSLCSYVRSTDALLIMLNAFTQCVLQLLPPPPLNVMNYATVSYKQLD